MPGKGGTQISLAITVKMTGSSRASWYVRPINSFSSMPFMLLRAHFLDARKVWCRTGGTSVHRAAYHFYWLVDGEFFETKVLRNLKISTTFAYICMCVCMYVNCIIKKSTQYAIHDINCCICNKYGTCNIIKFNKYETYSMQQRLCWYNNKLYCITIRTYVQLKN